MHKACRETEKSIAQARKSSLEKKKESALEWFIRRNGKTPAELASTPKTAFSQMND